MNGIRLRFQVSNTFGIHLIKIGFMTNNQQQCDSQNAT